MNADGKTTRSFMDKTPAKGPLLAQRNNKQTSQQQQQKNTPYQVRGPTPGHLAEGEVARDDGDFGEAKTINVEIYLENNNDTNQRWTEDDKSAEIGQWKKTGFLRSSGPSGALTPPLQLSEPRRRRAVRRGAPRCAVCNRTPHCRAAPQTMCLRSAPLPAAGRVSRCPPKKQCRWGTKQTNKYTK